MFEIDGPISWKLIWERHGHITRIGWLWFSFVFMSMGWGRWLNAYTRTCVNHGRNNPDATV